MFPFIIHSGDLVIPTFFFMMMLGVMASTFYMYFLAPRHGFSQIVVLDCSIVGTICGILGGRLFHVFVEALWFYQENPWRFFEFWRGGFVSYGAFIGGTIGILVYLKIKKQPILEYVDFIALAVPLMVVFIRIGCLGAGCCYGKPTDFPLYLAFHNRASEAGSKFPGIHLHASQVYDLLNGMLIFIVLNWRYKYRRFKGEIVLLFFMLYAFIRGLIEFLRGDAERVLWLQGSVSTGQITGVVIIALCVVIYVLLYRKAKKTLS